MDDLTEFIAARLDEDEQIARDAAGDSDGIWGLAGNISRSALSRVGTSREVFQLSSPEDALHIVHQHPARVLREVTAKRAIVALHAVEVRREPRRALAEDIADSKPPWWCEDERGCVLCGWFDGEQGGCPTVRHLAATWSDHPDYRQEWKP